MRHELLCSGGKDDTGIVRFLQRALCAGAVLALALGAGACTEESVASRVSPFLQCGDPLQAHTGRATYYTFADGSGNCLFDATPNDLMVVALNTADYSRAFLCGGSIRVTGPKGQVTVRVVDRCEGCAPNDIDLSPQAFEKIGDIASGSVPVTWQLVATEVQGPIVYHFIAESSQWWTAVQVRNHRYPVSSFEYRTPAGTFKPVERETYNYFVEPAGMGPGPYVFRVRDIYGRTLTDSVVALSPGQDVPGHAQFPPCSQ